MNIQTVVCTEAGDYGRMPPVKGALILLSACSPPPPFEDFTQYQLLTQACKHISTLISPETLLWTPKKNSPFEIERSSPFEDYCVHICMCVWSRRAVRWSLC